MPNAESLSSIKVVVNGQPVDVPANENAALEALISHALKESANSGQPRDNWVLKDAAGNVLDPNRKLRDLNLAADVILYLSLKAGVGG